jgi:hypothetical protein
VAKIIFLISTGSRSHGFDTDFEDPNLGSVWVVVNGLGN